MFFQFYAGLLRNGFDIPHDYRSIFRPAQLKQYKKPEVVGTSSKQSSKPSQSQSQKPVASISEQKTFEEIREKLILTNVFILGFRKLLIIRIPRKMLSKMDCFWK